MDPATAKALLEKEFHKIKIQKLAETVEVAFMGGEPLLNFELIQSVSNWIWTLQLPFSLELTIRTNGTLLTPAIKEWFKANREKISVGLSMDGLSDMNSENRTDRAIDWPFFLKNWPRQKVKVVLFKDSVNLLSRTVREMNAKPIPFQVVIGEGFEWDRESAGIFERELVELIPDYLDSGEEAEECGLFSHRIADFFPKYVMTETPFCGKANNIISFDIDGSPCICHLFSAPVLGHEKARYAWEKFCTKGMIPMDSQCVECPLQKNCKTCVGMNYKICGSIYQSAAIQTICNAIKAKARACALLCLKRAEQKNAKLEILSAQDMDDIEKSFKILDEIPDFTI
jgi:sulfatase maturation enzyme AslB (radical SAM superfamily)